MRMRSTIPPFTEESGAGVPDRDKLQFLVAQCSEVTKSFPDLQFRFSAAIAIVLGWVLTSQEAKSFIGKHASVSRIGAVVLCGMLVIFHSIWVFKHYKRADRIHIELNEFATRVLPEGKAFLESLRIDPFLPWSYLAVNLFVCGAIVVAVWLAAA
jgi:hypothetical protein